MIVKLFETQSQLIAAQVQAVTLPPLTSFDGQSDGDMSWNLNDGSNDLKRELDWQSGLKRLSYAS